MSELQMSWNPMFKNTKSSLAFSKLSKLWDSECRYPSDSPCVTIKNAKVTLPHQHTSPSMQHLGSISFSGLRLQTDLLMKKSSAIECYTRCLVTSTQIWFQVTLAQLCNPTALGSSKVPGLFRFIAACIFVSPVPGSRAWNKTDSLLGIYVSVLPPFYLDSEKNGWNFTPLIPEIVALSVIHFGISLIPFLEAHWVRKHGQKKLFVISWPLKLIETVIVWNHIGRSAGDDIESCIGIRSQCDS